MAGTTPKGFRYPEDSDAPNIAQDIENLATDVDTELDDYLTTASASSTYIAKSIVTAQGDLITASGSATPTRLGIGSADTYLKSDGTAVSWQSVPTGLTWTQRIAKGELSFSLVRGAGYGNSLWYVYGDQVTSNNAMVGSSTDGITWTTQTLPTTIDPYAMRWSTVGSIWILAGTTGSLFTSTDLITWTTRTPQFSTDSILDIAENGSTIVIVGANARISSSTDGISWTTRTSSLPPGGDMQRVVWGSVPGKFVANCANELAAVYSTDGITWASASTTSTMYQLFYVNGYYYVTTNTTAGRYSTDGITWTALASHGLTLGTQTENSRNYVELTGNKLLSYATNSTSNFLTITDLTTLYNNSITEKHYGVAPSATGAAATISLANNGDDVLLVTQTGGGIFTNF